MLAFFEKAYIALKALVQLEKAIVGISSVMVGFVRNKKVMSMLEKL